MSVRRIAVSGLAAVVLAIPAVAIGSAGAAAAHPQVQTGKHCPTKHGKYPPGKCQVLIKHHKTHHHEKVHFKSGKVFKPGERVRAKIVCTAAKVDGKHHAEKLIHSHSAGRAHNIFVLHKPLRGTCTLTLTGIRSGTTLVSHISL